MPVRRPGRHPLPHVARLLVRVSQGDRRRALHRARQAGAPVARGRRERPGEGCMTIAGDMAARCLAITYDALSPEVVDRVKYLLLDHLGVAARGAQIES